MIGRVIMVRKMRNKLEKMEKPRNKLRSDWRELGMIGRVIMVRKMRNRFGKKGKTGEDVTE